MTDAGWEPRCCTVIGAAHRRRGQPCQDASLACRLQASGSGSLQLIAVADGHGNRRHWLSAEGSTLACQAAERAVRQALTRTPLAAIERWQELLQRDLPAAIVQDWLAATAADWAARPEAGEQPFTPLAYGSTLGLVLLTPHWWGCTGLGDWDLVAISAAGEARLISEERGDGSGGEATASLCLPGAADLFAERVTLEPLGAAAGRPDSRTLVLSSDGLRKSCLTDADFLQLCCQLSTVVDPAELQTGLAQVTAEGSGDDISVAMVHPLGPPAQPRRPLARWLALLLLGAGALAATGWWWLRQPVPDALDREIARQCAAPDRIRANLNQRQAQFRQLLQPQADARPLNAERDPLGAVIAASRLGPLSGCTTLERELRLQWQRAAGRPPSDRPAGRMPTTPLPTRLP
ncbi:MAG: hypothetical protein RLZZ423_1808 [Cyanobacteriota bacterium]